MTLAIKQLFSLIDLRSPSLCGRNAAEDGLYVFLFMPIPDFDHNFVIPPHRGNPASAGGVHVSPYDCSSVELCHRFATSPARIGILKLFLQFRTKMVSHGITEGFQWIDGSFSEDIEAREHRDPKDLDVVTFFKGTFSNAQVTDIKTNFQEFSNPKLSKTTYKLDHYPVKIDVTPEITVEKTRYWLQLFSHNRNNIWKGILRIQLNTATDDQHALDFLNTL